MHAVGLRAKDTKGLMAKFIALIAIKRNLANGRGNNQQFKSVVGLVNDIFFGTTLAFRSIRMLEAKSVVNPPFFGGQWFKISFLAPQGIRLADFVQKSARFLLFMPLFE